MRASLYLTPFLLSIPTALALPVPQSHALTSTPFHARSFTDDLSNLGHDLKSTLDSFSASVVTAFDRLGQDGSAVLQCIGDVPMKACGEIFVSCGDAGIVPNECDSGVTCLKGAGVDVKGCFGA